MFHTEPLLPSLTAGLLFYKPFSLKKKSKMKHLCIFLLQVIHLWFEEFALEDTQLCTGDFVTLRDALGTIGKSHIKQTSIQPQEEEEVVFLK